jgi:hypothetical protein
MDQEERGKKTGMENEHKVPDNKERWRGFFREPV